MNNKLCETYGAAGSAIRELFSYGLKRKQEIGEDNVFDFSLGNPSVPTPKKFDEALIQAIKTMPTVHNYTNAVGDIQTRIAISLTLNKHYGCHADANLMYLTCGAAASLTISLKAITSSPDEEIICFAPFFPEYRTFITNAGAKIVICPPDDKMMIDFSKLEKLINKNTIGVIIDSPNNPTGAIYSEEIIQKLSDLLRAKEKEFNKVIYFISDEPYRELIYTDKKYPFITNYYDDSIVLYSYSKSLSLPGERIGYILVNDKCKDATQVYNCIKGAGRLMGFVNAPSLFQKALALEPDLPADLATYKKNRDLLYTELTKIGYDCILPEGAFYLFLKSLEPDAMKFSEVAKKYELLVVPSDSFGIKGYIRLAYCVSTKTIENSIPAFKALYDSYQK